jgi:putative nucleotidyltransferase with HDIG domain
MSAARFRESWRDAIRAINRRPGEGWRANVAHHGFRIAVVLGIALLVPVFFPRQPLPEAITLDEGMVATQDVIAEFDVTVRKPPDQLASERAEAERSVAPIYVLDPAAADSAAGLVESFFRRADTAFAPVPDGGVDSVTVASLIDAYGLDVNERQLGYMADSANRRVLESSLQTAYSQMLPRGVASILDLGTLASTRVLVRSPGQDRIMSRDSVVTVGRFFQDALVYAPEDGSIDGFQLYQNLLVRFTVPSLQSDDLATRAARDQARAAVDTIMGAVLEGERIISAHEIVGRRDIVRLRAYNAELARQGRASAGGRRQTAAGAVLYSGVLLSLFGVLLFFFRPAIYQDVRGYMIIMGLIVVVLGAAGIVAQGGYAPELIPIALLALLVGALYDGLMAVIAVMITAGLLGAASPLLAVNAINVPFLTLAAGAAGALAVGSVRRRSHSWVLIALITGAYILAGIALTLLQSLPARDLLSTAAWGAVSATLCTVLAIGALVPALEKITGISTDQTLLELSDLNASALRELSRKAPGTYAHSINVANLAEAACTAIGANPLLARAGVYYHDIGKMVNPQYFVENQPKGRNPHDRLPPAKSAAIIRDHVREGLRLASEHRLPPVVHDFIREHHGTTVIAYFLDKARSEDPDLELDPNDFAYPGPKPQTKETAVVMLADGIESSTRVLQDPTPDRIRRTIEQIVSARVDENQLDQSPLTMRDLDLVKVEFARVLIGMYHRRIEYPSGVRAREEIHLPDETGAGTASGAVEEPTDSGSEPAAETGSEVG